MTTTFTITHPDGTVSKRTSKSRTYTHGVEASRQWAEIRAEREHHVEYLARQVANADDRNRPYYEGALAAARAELAATPTEGTYYYVSTWCGRPDLAAKAMRSAPAGARVVPVD